MKFATLVDGIVKNIALNMEGNLKYQMVHHNNCVKHTFNLLQFITPEFNKNLYLILANKST